MLLERWNTLLVGADSILLYGAAQVHDKRDLEYQAGQEEQEKEGAKKPDQAQGKDEEGAADATQQQGGKQEPDQAQEEEEEDAAQRGGEEGPVNEDTEDRYEQRQWAAPEVPSRFTWGWDVVSCIVQL